MHKATAIQSFDFGTLTSGYDAGTFTPVEVAHAVVARIAAAGDDRVWISRVPNAALLARGSSTRPALIG
jgi:allophanate hydrolase